MSHYESFDPKPEAPVDIRGEFKQIKTATPGIQFCEHIPLLPSTPTNSPSSDRCTTTTVPTPARFT